MNTSPKSSYASLVADFDTAKASEAAISTRRDRSAFERALFANQLSGLFRVAIVAASAAVLLSFFYAFAS